MGVRRYYYKATRPDGTDFRTGTIEYRVGETVTHPAARRVRDDPSTYLSVSTVATDCTGFSWPCRLFVVEGVGRPLRAEGMPNKRCFSSVRVVEERPAWEVFGPHGEEVVALIGRTGRLTRSESRLLSAAWYAARDAARDAALGAARDAARYAARDAVRYAASAARDAAWYAARYAAWYAARDAAWDAAWDAASAIVVRDLITPEQFHLLYGPWASVMGDK